MAKFNSHIKKLRIVLKPATPIFEGGLKVGDQPGIYAQFEDGQFDTQDEAVISQLEKLNTFSIDFWRVSDESSPVEDTTVDKDFVKLTKKELQSLAKEKGVEVDGTESKERLVELLTDK
jgi:hypothetical protein